MRGNYASPSELLLALRETGKSYWDLIGKPLNQNTGYNLNNPHAAEEKQYNEWYDSLKLSDEDNIKLQQLLSEYDKNVKSNTDSLPKYKKGKDKFHSFAAQMGPRIYRELHKQGIYSNNTYDNMMRQLAWESNYANSLNAINNHNYAGIRKSATKYAKYKNDDLFAQEYVSLIKRKYPNAVKAKNPVLYAKALKDNGYYEDSVEHYALSLAAMSSISNAVKAHMAANPSQYEVEVLLDDLKKQSELPAVSTTVAKPINREPINKEPFVNTPIPTEAPLITRPEYLESNSLIKKSFELNMNNMLLGKDFLFKLPGFKKGKNPKKPLSDEQYIKIMEDVANANYEHWGYPNQDAALLYVLNANDYDYRGYYNKYPPNSANSLTHWSDEFKTAYHPSFSDESKYSGHKSKYNPDGIVGGHWYNEMFVPSFDQLRKLNKLPHFRGGKDGNQPSTYYAGTLPEVTSEAYAPIRLTTYYPVVSKYPYTGHSELKIPIDRATWWDYTGEKEYPERLLPYVTIDKKSGAPDYNLVTNNCADATLNYLNKAFNTHESPMLFTTPGDVRDYAIHKLHGKLVHNDNGSDTVLIPRNAKNKTKISKEALDLYSNGPKRTARVAYHASFKNGKDSGIKEYASNEDMHVNPDGSITTRNGNTGSVILPDVNVYAQKDYNSAFDYSGANEVMGTIADFTPVVGDVKQGLEAANDLRKGNYKEAAIGAGLLLLPNVLEKPLKYAGKKAFNFLSDITPKQWTAAQDAAIARGDMVEAQRLRDLHARVKGYSPIHEYHGSNRSFREFKESPYGIYFTPDESAAEGYVRGSSPTKYNVYLNSGNDVITIDNGGLPWNKIPETKAADAFGISKEDLHSIVGRYNVGAQPWYYDYLYPFGFKPKTNYYAVDQLAAAAEQQGKTSLKLIDAVDSGKKVTAIKRRLYDQHIVFKPNQIKSADAVTYDDNGIRIPLGKRDNFSINDIRYGLIPFGVGLTGYGLVKNQKTSGSSTRKGNTKK